MRLIIGSLMLGMAAYWLARGVGIPHFTGWDAGDAMDIGILVCVGAYLIGSR